MKSLYSLPCKWRVWLLVLVLSQFSAFGQQIGYIFQPSSGTILDPNSDGWISASGGAIDTSVVIDESFDFEYPMIPMFHLSMEPPADLQTGNDCGKSEIVDNPNYPMSAGYWYLGDVDGIPGNGDEFLMYRMRIARNVNGAYGFSFLIDTDNRMGFTGATADPNAVVGNPGFEIEVIYGTAGAGLVSIVDVDGTTTGTVMSTYPGPSHSQRSHAGFTNCPLSDPIFLDFYIPFDSLGVGPNDTIRMIFATSSSANSALGGSASDIGGINDGLYGNGDSIFIAITDSTPSFTFGGCGWAIAQQGAQVSCHGDSDGWAWVDVWGGAPPTSYLWSTGDTTDTVYGLPAGTYTIYITSGGGCTDTVDVVVTEPDSLIANIDITDSILCFGDLNGTLAGFATGGTPPYTTSWSNGAITDTLTNMGVGTYTYYVTDANGCQDSLQITLTQPPVLEVVIQNQNEILCYGDSIGSLDILITGGTPPYSVLWNDGNTDSLRNNLVAGTYSVVVTDANGCQDSLTVTLDQPAQPVGGLTILETAVSCFGGSDGVGVVVATGGRSPYTFLWDNGETNDTAVALTAGTHTVVVTDSVGCTDTLNLLVTQPDTALTLVAVLNNPVSCFGGTDGQITANVSGGTLPYSFLWSTGDTTSSITGPAGTYSVVVTDFLGCIDSATVTITEPLSPLIVTITDSSDVDCFGDADGFATATASGGTPPYDFEWSNGVTDTVITGLSGGVYTVVVTDINGCIDSATVTIIEPSAALVATATIIDSIQCNGDSDGSGYVAVTGGTAPYTILWSNAATTDTITGLVAGTYTVTVTDANGCIDSSTIVLTEPLVLNVSQTVDANVLCFGDSTGEATITVTGGTTPYTYAWSTGHTTAVVTNLTVGTHTVVVTDANGCMDSVTVTITQPAAALTAGTSSTTGVTCRGDVDGSASATASGGTPPYTYNWSNGMSGQNISGLAGGDYILTVTDANGCVAIDTVNIFEPAFDLLVGAADGTTITCNGASDGTAYASASGGVPPYTFSWSNGMTGDTITGITAGTYIVTVTDSMGCTDTNTVIVTQPDSLLLNVSFSNITCFGLTDGAASAAPTGGEAPYSYLWNTGATSSSITGLSAGTYFVSVTDNRGCTQTDTIVITSPSMPLAAIIVFTDVNCFGGSDGTATANGSGGVSPYTYLWSDGQTTQTATNLAPGSYYVIMTDANGCQDSAFATIAQPASPLTASTSLIASPTCGVLNGSVYAQGAGGTPPYTYAWNNGTANDTATGLGGGPIIVTVTDSNGCIAVDTITVPSPAPGLVVTGTVIGDISCYGSSDGVIYGSATGGTAPYTISWSTGHVGDTLTGVSAGSYTVFVVDSNGCSASSTVNIGQPDSITTATVLVNNVSCFGGADGSASVSASGGTPGYTYLWNNGQTTATATGLIAGYHTVTVTDANGCIAIDSILITQPATAVDVSAVMDTAVSCFGGSDGVATATGSGGTPPYTYAWSNGQSGATATGLSAGTYTVTVTDSLGCTDTVSVNITQPASAVDVNSATIFGVSCVGSSDGWATVQGSGGTAPYTYSWSNGQTGDSATNLAAGTYLVTITDANGCQDTTSLVIPEPSAPLSAVAIDGMTISCFGGSDGTAYASVTGGWAPYTYSWSTGSTNDTITGIPVGTYTVTVTDSLGCQSTADITLSQPTQVSASATLITNVLCFGGADGSAYVVGNGGTPPYTYLWPNGETNDTAIALTVGTHIVTVTDSNGCSTTVSVSVSQPSTAVSAGASALTNVLCFGDSTATARATATGGVAPYTYLWNNGQTTRTATGLWAGTHTVIVTDANGCTDTATVTITQPATAVDASAVMTAQVSCFGGNDGRATASATGGTPPYTFLWSNGVSGANTNTLSSQWYYVTVTDANGCTDTAMVFIQQPSAPVAVTGVVVQNVTCFAGADGIAWANVVGGTPPYTYLWSDGQTTDTAIGLAAGNYAVLVTDSLGCQDLISVVITQPATDIMANASVAITPSCYGGADGAAYATVTNGYPPFTYLWSDGQTTDTAVGLTAGTYTVTVTDSLGCDATASVTISAPPQDIILTPTVVSNVNCLGGADGSGHIFAQGGTPPYTYLWSNGDTTVTATGLTAGTHSVYVFDSQGCADTATLTITEPATAVDASASVLFPVNCFGGSDGYATATATGGTPPYSYVWSDGQTGYTALGLDTGWYVVTVTDANGCQDTAHVFMTQPDSAVRVSIDILNNVSCLNGSNGTALASATGGTPPYSFDWDHGASTAMAAGLPAGTYTVTVTDNNGCQDSLSVTITQPATQLTLSALQLSPVSCFGGADGSAYALANGGDAPYSYVWSNGQTNDTITGLVAGSYTVTVTDSNGCQVVVGVNITQPTSAVSVSASVLSNVDCFGNATGSATANATGGTPGYTYLWSDGQTTSTAIGLVAGSYSVTVTDANGCTDTSSVVITQPSAALTSTSTVVQNVSCFGGNNGLGYVTYNGGTAPYSVSWSNGAITDTLSNLIAGMYTVTITDANGCTTQDTIIITQPAAALAASAVVNANVLCFGNATGSATASATGGTAPYSYAWSNGATTASITNLVAGTYSVTITDVNGCTDTASVTITQPALALSVSLASSQNIDCFGNATGSASVTVTGGTSPYSYAWSNGGTTASITGLVAGTYNLTVTDANGCTDTLSVTLTQPSAALTSTSTVVQNVSCFGGNNGLGYVTYNGGTAPYSVSWSNGATTDTLSNLIAGTYTVTITDANGCTTQDTIIITQPAAALAASAVVNANVLCFGNATGSATASATGGTAPYSYAWSNGGTTASISNLVAGTYSVTIMDANGCTDTASVTITQPALALSLSLASSQNIDCFGNATGSASVTVTGGTAPYSYAWSNGGNTASITGLVAGTYNLTVTDANGCTDTLSVTLTQPSAALTSTSTVVQNVSCFGGNNGLGYVTYNGGTAPYSVSWSNGATTDTLSNLIAGTYTVTITDANGCTTQDTIIITQPAAALAASAVVNANVLCFGNATGSASASATGGTTPYSYAWSNGGTTASISNLVAGTYSVTIMDANGCTDTASVTITQPSAALAVSLVATNNINCFGNATGAIDVTATGGTAPYSFVWSNGFAGATITGLLAGSYTVTVTDANGCTDTLSVTLTQPSAALTSTSTVVQNVSCFGGNNGLGYVTYNGGTAPYSVSWSNGAITDTLSNLIAGTYTVTITDANGCTTQDTIIITQPAAALAASAVVNTNVLCFGNATGSAMASATGGTAPYSYAWSNGATTASITNLVAGTYSVTITDVNGCTDSASVTITQPTGALAISLIASQGIDCFGSATGSASVNVTGGTAPYSYAWSNGATTAALSNLPAGTYVLTVTDANGCSDTLSVTLNQPASPLTSATSVIQNVNCFGGNDGQAYTTYNGGTPPYSVSWSNGSTSDTLSNLTAGTYSVTITDANGCTTQDSVVITQPGAALVANAVVSSNVLCFGDATGSATANPTGGTAPYSYAWSNGGITGTINNLTAGTYTVTVTDANGCVAIDSAIITEPTQLVANITIISNVNCFNGSDGALTASATGGTAPYTYSWSNGTTGVSNTNLTAGSYTVTITDANGCIQTSTVQITQPATGTTVTTSTISDVSCNGGADGSVTVSATGGQAPYAYTWSNGQTGASISGLTAGTYTVTVTDAAGCPTIYSVVINEPTPIVITKGNSNNVNCFGGSDGSASITVSGGTSPYTINWSNGATGLNANNLTVGTYVATVTDANGCQDTVVFAIRQPASGLAAANGFIQNVSCFDGNDGAAYVNISGGTAPYSVSWSNGSTNDTISNLRAGSYTAIVTDANGCMDSTTVVITQPSSGISALLTVHQHVYCKGEQSGILSVSVSGGTAPYSLLWSNGSTSDSLSFLAAGTYTLTVTDANGCVEVFTAVVTEPNQNLNANPNQVSPVYCYGEDDGVASVQPRGGTAPYTIAWSNGATGDTITNLGVGRYYVTITDANGCFKTDSVDILGPNQDLNANPTVVNVNCGGMNSGEISVNPFGGTPPYNITWQNGFAGPNISNLPVGKYAYTVIDGAGCVMEDTVEVTENEPIESNIDVQFATCPNSADGYVSITSQGGMPPYTYLFDGQPFGGTRSDIVPGSHSITVQDAAGCDSTFYIYVGVDQETNYLHIPNAFTPNDDLINEKFEIFGSECIGPSRFQIFDRWGNLVFSTHDPLNEFWDGYRGDGTKCKEDVYVWVFKSDVFERRGHVTVVH